MVDFEESLEKENMLPKFYNRYVDDIFVILKKNEINETLNMLNNKHPNIKFTCEIEENQSLPFLDIRIIRENRVLKFDVYRKHTATNRYITSDSFCSFQHKISAFNSMIHRLCILPLSVKNYMSELETIKNITKVNGFEESIIESLVKKHSNKIKMRKIKSLLPLKDKEEIKRISFNYTN